MREPLPVDEIRGALEAAAAGREGVRVVVEAPTGSGKSTRVPQFLLEAGAADLPGHGRRRGEIVVLQPRRLAARLLAKRVADERGARLGGEVGYQVRFERVCGAETRIRFVTEGVLLREMVRDPALSGVAAIVFDEFHERHLDGDLLLGRARGLQDEGIRPDLGIFVMSATLQDEPLRSFLGGGARWIRCEGRTFPVAVEHAPPRVSLDRTLPEQVVRACRDVLSRGLGGHLLVFLPGAYEIRRTVGLLEGKSWTRGLHVCPLFGDLPPAQQDAAVAPGGADRIIVATNVAETSVTIDGVRAVIDSGLARLAAFDPRREINTLTVQRISRASADQRAGRAGRTGPGLAVRLWSERDHQARPAVEVPEVHRLDLAEAVLALAASGVDDLVAFPWVEAPAEESLRRAVRLLEQLGALDRASGAVTPTGRAMTRFPVHPRFARVLLEAAELGCLPEAALSIALVQGRPIFQRTGGGRGGAARGAPMKAGRRATAGRRTGGDSEARGVAAFAEDDDSSDFIPQIRAWQFARARRFDRDACEALGIHAGAAREAGAVFHQLMKAAKAGGLETGPEAGEEAGSEGAERSARDVGEALGRALLAGFSDHLALRTSAGGSACEVVGGRRGQATETSVLRNHRLVVAAEITEVEGREMRVLLNHLTGVEEAWLADLFPDDFSDETVTEWDPAARRVVGRHRMRFRDLVLESRERGEPDPDAAAGLLADEVAAGHLVLKKWDHSVEQWIARVNSLAAWMSELEIPPLSEDDRRFVLREICTGARSYREIKDRSPWPVLDAWLSPPQKAALEVYAPERVTLAGGRRAKVVYTDGEPPRIGATVQELFGQATNPAVADGRVPVVVEVLAPNRRPVQVTSDLASFWESGYPEVRRQLKGRYPKHHWP